jgi:hypothetical protein
MILALMLRAVMPTYLSHKVMTAVDWQLDPSLMSGIDDTLLKPLLP